MSQPEGTGWIGTRSAGRPADSDSPASPRADLPRRHGDSDASRSEPPAARARSFGRRARGSPVRTRRFWTVRVPDAAAGTGGREPRPNGARQRSRSRQSVGHRRHGVSPTRGRARMRWRSGTRARRSVPSGLNGTAEEGAGVIRRRQLRRRDGSRAHPGVVACPRDLPRDLPQGSGRRDPFRFSNVGGGGR